MRILERSSRLYLLSILIEILFARTTKVNFDPLKTIETLPNIEFAVKLFC